MLVSLSQPLMWSLTWRPTAFSSFLCFFPFLFVRALGPQSFFLLEVQGWRVPQFFLFPSPVCPVGVTFSSLAGYVFTCGVLGIRGNWRVGLVGLAFELKGRRVFLCGRFKRRASDGCSTYMMRFKTNCDPPTQSMPTVVVRVKHEPAASGRRGNARQP